MPLFWQRRVRPLLRKLKGTEVSSCPDWQRLVGDEHPQCSCYCGNTGSLASVDYNRGLQGRGVCLCRETGCYTVLEGSAMVRAARKYGRKVQVGTHRRVSPHNLSAYEFVKSGKLGKIATAMCLMSNVSMKLGRSISWDGKAERTGDAEADKLLKREYRGEWQYPI